MKKYVPTWRDNEVRALSDLAGGFFAREIVAQNEKWDAQHHIDRNAWLEAGKLGLLCCSIPEEYGGGGGTFAHDLAVFDAQGYAGDLAFGISVHSGIVAHYI
ncbi:MAG: acyl-CoA dehydrogenase family protein, partial [Cytophagaceae bacterium]